jgi:hypothetical protein
MKGVPSPYSAFLFLPGRNAVIIAGVPVAAVPILCKRKVHTAKKEEEWGVHP